MDNKSVPKRRNINSAKINPAVVPVKIRKTELPLEKLTETNWQIQRTWGIISEIGCKQRKNLYVNKILKDRLEELEA